MCDKEQMTKVQVMMSRFYNRLQTKFNKVSLSIRYVCILDVTGDVFWERNKNHPQTHIWKFESMKFHYGMDSIEQFSL